ncbi:hypothetical protein LSAT2_001023 [Lamellibrachia satsuma]|nr:hypothetical protein LSAT2_001023 [Lamellibrachia satsuma]
MWNVSRTQTISSRNVHRCYELKKCLTYGAATRGLYGVGLVACSLAHTGVRGEDLNGLRRRYLGRRTIVNKRHGHRSDCNKSPPTCRVLLTKFAMKVRLGLCMMLHCSLRLRVAKTFLKCSPVIANKCF